MASLLYLVSLKERAGKTALAAALLDRWRKSFSVAYVCRDGSDSKFIGQSLGIDTLSLDQLKEALSCYKLVLVEALCSEITIEGQVLLLAFYPGDELDEILRIAESLGEGLLGIVINAVPSNRLKDNPWERALKDWKPHKNDKLTLLGLIPQDRELLSPTIGEIAQVLEGHFVDINLVNVDEVVEHFMVGVYSLDPAPLYYGLRKNKVVIFRGDRADMQLGALETETKLLILTEGLQPHPYVRHLAEIKRVPIMVVPDDTLMVMSKLELLTSRLRFRQKQKIAKMSRLVEGHLQLDLLEKSLL